MKTQLLNLLGAVAVLFFVGCAGNPTESPEYKAMLTSYETMVGEQTAAQSALVTAQDGTKQLLGTLSGLGEEAADLKGEWMQRATSMLASNGETLKAHAEMSANHAAMIAKHNAGMKMDAIQADFETIKADMSKMMADYASMTDGQNQLAQGIQGVLATATAPVVEEEEKKK